MEGLADELLRGVQPGNLAILGDRPGNGKTTFALSLAYTQLELRHQVDRDREADSAAAAAAAAATASAQREWLGRLVSAASGIGNTLARMSSDSENSRANQQVSALLRGRRHGQ